MPRGLEEGAAQGGLQNVPQVLNFLPKLVVLRAQILHFEGDALIIERGFHQAPE
jgi:hypothetical protein